MPDRPSKRAKADAPAQKKPRQKRWRDMMAEDCPVCLAPMLKRCQDYRGSGKAPCSIPLVPPPPKEPLVAGDGAELSEGKPAWWSWNQLLLWDDMPPF